LGVSDDRKKIDAEVNNNLTGCIVPLDTHLLKNEQVLSESERIWKTCFTHELPIFPFMTDIEFQKIIGTLKAGSMGN
jgi:hypothetical protein